MAKEFFDYNPENDLTSYTEEGDTEDDLIIRTEQDVEPILDALKAKRNHEDDSGIKKGHWHYCSIPVTVQHEMLKKGINIFNKHQTAEVLKEINTNYPYLKATRKNHAI